MKKWIPLLFICGVTQAAPPVITPSTVTVYVSSNVVITADQSVTFSLLPGSTGTLSGATATSVTYNAPGNITTRHSYFGCSLFPNDSVFYTDISGLPVDTSTTTYLHAQISGAAIVPELDMAENLYNSGTPSTAAVFNYTSSSNGSFQIARFPDLAVENGVFSDKDQVDQHILSASSDTCNFSEMYKFYPIGTQSDCLTCNSQSGMIYGDHYSTTLGVDAAGLPILPFTVKYQELRDCVDGVRDIPHAMRITFSVGLLANSHIWPAIAHATDGGSIPFGKVFRLKSTFTNTGSAVAQCIQRAGKKYGFYANDGGINGHIQFQQDSGADYDLMVGLTGSMGFTTDDIEAVDMSPLQDTNTNSRSYGTFRVASTQTYTTASTYAVIVASNTSTHQYTMFPVIIQPVTIGVDRPVGYTFMAGTPQTPLNVWVKGAVNTAYTCSMSPTLGSLTAGGLYTAPTSVTSRSSTTVTCAASADAGATVRFPVIVYSSDTIRVRMQNANNADFTDASGYTWFAEKGAFYRLQGHANCDWSSDADSGSYTGLMQECQYVNSGSGDFRFKAFGPAGDYQINLYFAVGGSASPFTRGTWIQGIDSGGVIYSGNSAATMTGNGPWTALGLTGKQIDVCDITGSCASRTVGTVTLNKTFSDGNIDFAIRHIAPTGVSQPASMLNAFSISLTSSTSSSSQGSGSSRIRGTGRFQGTGILRR